MDSGNGWQDVGHLSEGLNFTPAPFHPGMSEEFRTFGSMDTLRQVTVEFTLERVDTEVAALAWGVSVLEASLLWDRHLVRGEN